MNNRQQDPPGWHFDAEEVSAGIYRAFGKDDRGRSIEKTGEDPDVLLEECRAEACKIANKERK